MMQRAHIVHLLIVFILIFGFIPNQISSDRKPFYDSVPNQRTLPSSVDHSTSSADVTIYGPTEWANTGGWFQYGKAYAKGDFNGDNYIDFAVGQPYADGPNNSMFNAGNTSIIFGGPRSNFGSTIDLSFQADITLYGAPGDNSGFSLAAGDIDNDGKDDLLIGAILGDDPFSFNMGVVYLIYGRSTTMFPSVINLSADADVTFYGVDYNDEFGNAIVVGDIDGDGYEDIFMAAWKADGVNNQKENSGEVYLFYGRNRFQIQSNTYIETNNDLIIYGPLTDLSFSKSLTMGDYNNDGKQDITFGFPDGNSPSYDRNGCGDVFIIFGNTKNNIPAAWDLFSKPPDRFIYGTDVGDSAGNCVASGDINSDGFDDLIINSRLGAGPSNSENGAGEVSILYGDYLSICGPHIDLKTGSNITIYGADENDQMGSDIGVGDIDGDTFDDILMGASFSNGPSESRIFCGEVYIIYGDEDLPSTYYFDPSDPSPHEDIIIYGEEEYDNLGRTVFTVDLDNDGFSDILSGAIFSDGFNNQRNNTGDIYLIYGELRPRILIGDLTIENDYHDALYAGYNTYIFQIELYNTGSAGDFSYVDLILDPDGDAIRVRFDPLSQADFYEINDPNDYINLFHLFDHDDGNKLTLSFLIVFEFEYPDENHHDVLVDCEGLKAPRVNKRFENVYKVENDLYLFGNLTMKKSENQEFVEEGDWVPGGQNLTLEGPILTYEGTTDVHPISGWIYSYYNLTFSDSIGNSWTETIDGGEPISMNITFPQDSIIGNILYASISSIPESCDLSDVQFIVNIDNDPPSNVVFVDYRPDSITDTPYGFDDDDEGFLVWWDAIDQHSGVDSYHYEVWYEETLHAVGSVLDGPSDENSIMLSDLEDGKYEAFVWAEDNVGNTGERLSVEFIIDSKGIIFSDASSTEDEWFNSIPFLFNITIEDEGPSGIDPDSVKYSISEDSFISTEWTKVNGMQSGSIINVSEHISPEDGRWFIKFKAADMAGNGPAQSDPFPINVDTIPVRFEMLHSYEKWYVEPTVDCSIIINDSGGSGVDIGSIEYSFSTDGLSNYGPWINVPSSNQGDYITVSVPITFDNGSDNYIRWRARDIAHNPYVISQDYQVIMNLSDKIGFYPPMPIISSPQNNSDYNGSDLILFDASGSLDLDPGDVLSFYWTSNIQGMIGIGQTFSRTLIPGTHLITLWVSDTHGYNVSRSVKVIVRVNETQEDETNDGTKESDNSKLIILVIIAVIIVVLTLLYFFKAKGQTKKTDTPDQIKPSIPTISPDLTYVPKKDSGIFKYQLEQSQRYPITNLNQPTETPQVSPQQIPKTEGPQITQSAHEFLPPGNN